MCFGCGRDGDGDDDGGAAVLSRRCLAECRP